MKPTAALVLLLLLVGCGGTAASPAGSAIAPPPTGSSPANPATGPNVVTVAAGQTAGGVDVAVAAPAGSPVPNALDLGVSAASGGGSAFNTGDRIHRGQTARVLLFGPGLTGDMQVTIRGPADIAITDLTSITSTTGTPGLSFVAAVTPNATLGARTVVLQTAKGDITTFTGGLEVLP